MVDHGIHRLSIGLNQHHIVNVVVRRAVTVVAGISSVWCLQHTTNVVIPAFAFAFAVVSFASLGNLRLSVAIPHSVTVPVDIAVVVTRE